jgi:hypothetical protein
MNIHCCIYQKQRYFLGLLAPFISKNCSRSTKGLSLLYLLKKKLLFGSFSTFYFKKLQQKHQRTFTAAFTKNKVTFWEF